VTHATKQAGADTCAVKHSTWRCDLGDGISLVMLKGTPSSTGTPYVAASLVFDMNEGTSPRVQMKKPGMKTGLKAMKRYGVKRDWVLKCLSKDSSALREKASRE
jgi:L-aminopeptidase/D-esterase-like protein